mmetsp:Transcript_22925/g.70846  ORF Transcript_22925/g.70846 Transcript_22925/m.70846 type:complete len:211 (+) Transcript_22925:789-1421(+)
MAHISSRATAGRILALSRTYRCATIELMLPHGRTSIVSGPADENPSASAWWSIRPTMRLARCGSSRSDATICFGSLWSTRHTLSREPSAAATPAPGVVSNSGGASRPATSSACVISPLSPSSDRQATPPNSSAAPTAPAMLSRSVLTCPTNTQPRSRAYVYSSSKNAASVGTTTRFLSSFTRCSQAASKRFSACSVSVGSCSATRKRRMG